MPSRHWVGLVFICLSLQSCALYQASHDLQVGKVNFTGGNYAQAFHVLLPVAVNGNAEAQYAVGYMYYYGYGVSQDTESGLFWMNKAAEQHYAPAMKALDIIKQKSAVTTPAIKPVRQVSQSINVHDELLRSIQDTSLTLSPQMALNKSSYGLQLFGAYELSSAKSVQKKLRLQDSTHIWRATHNGKDWFVLTYGKYSSMMDAKLAQDNLAGTLSELKPWVRKLDALERVG